MRTRRNKPAVSGEVRSFRVVRRLNLNRTYVPIKIGVVAGYILLAMLSASTSMFGILVGAMLRIAGFWNFCRILLFEQLFGLRNIIFIFSCFFKNTQWSRVYHEPVRDNLRQLHAGDARQREWYQSLSYSGRLSMPSQETWKESLSPDTWSAACQRL